MAGQAKLTYQICSGFDGASSLVWALRRNAETFREAAVSVPRPRTYRAALAQLLDSDTQGEQADEVVANLVDDQSRAVFLSDVHTMAPGPTFWDGAAWFSQLSLRAERLYGLFPDVGMRFFIGMRSPDELLSEALTNKVVRGIDPIPDPFALSWSDLISDLRARVPNVPVTTWCAEELPFIWDRLMRLAVDMPDDIPLAGAFEPLHNVMSETGLERLEAYLKSRTGFPPETRARIISVFVQKFVPEELREDELRVPGWDTDQRARMEEHYSADVAAVADIDGVDFISI